MTSKIVPPPLPKKRANNKLETILSPLNLNLCIKIISILFGFIDEG